ncbi:MAG: hypothetical protein WD651_05635 [Acidimicrobiia bacterium]
MRTRYALAITTFALAVVMIAAPAFAWEPVISGDCEGWHVNNPDKKWNTPDHEMVVDGSIVVAYDATVDIADNSVATERTFHVFWRLIGDTEEIEAQNVVATREECEATTTTAEVAGETAEATTTTAVEPPTTAAAQETTPARVLGIQVEAGGVAAQQETLPFTGISLPAGLAIATGLLAAGTSCLVFAQRNRVEQNS